MAFSIKILKNRPHHKTKAKSIIASRIDDKRTALEKSSATIVVDDLNQVNLNDFIN